MARAKLSAHDKETIRQIERIRRNSNALWMGIVRLVMTHARKEARKIFAKIEANDRRIYELTRRLAK